MGVWVDDHNPWLSSLKGAAHELACFLHNSAKGEDTNSFLGIRISLDTVIAFNRRRSLPDHTCQPQDSKAVVHWYLSLLRRCGCQERTVIAIVAERVDTSLIFKGQSANEPNCTSPQKFGSNCWLSSIFRGLAPALEYNTPSTHKGCP